MLLLADGSITLQQLLLWRLPHLTDVILSCCETGLGIVQNLTDDIITLSTGFLCAGAISVVSTLWTVNDLATSLFSIFYHEARQQGCDRPSALQQAQLNLRTLTGKTLKTEYRPQLELYLTEQYDRAIEVRDAALANREGQIPDTAAYQEFDTEYQHYEKMRQRIYKVQESLKELCKELRPFESPFYWAAFTCQGLN